MSIFFTINIYIYIYIYIANIGTVWGKKYIWRLGIIRTSLWILLIFFAWLLGPKFFDTSRPKFVNTLRPKCVDSSCKQYMFNRNIQTFWQKTLCIKTWYSSKSLWILSVFLVWFFRAKMFPYPKSYATT